MSITAKELLTILNTTKPIKVIYTDSNEVTTVIGYFDNAHAAQAAMDAVWTPGTSVWIDV